MSNSEQDTTLSDEASLQRAERTLLAQIDLCASSADTAFKHALRLHNASALAVVDREAGLLQTLGALAERLKEHGRPAPHARLGAILNDLMLARATLAKTLGILTAADHADAAALAKARAATLAQQQTLIDERQAQTQRQANEHKKLL